MGDKPTAPTPAAIGDKSRLVARAALRGAMGGLMWSVPMAVFAHVGSQSMHPPVSFIVWVYVWTIVPWTSIAATAEALRAREWVMSDEARRVVKSHVRRAVIRSSLFATPVAAFFAWRIWQDGDRDGGSIVGAIFILGLWVGIAAHLGMGRGMRVARKLDEEALERARTTTLDDHTRPPGTRAVGGGASERILVRTDVHLTCGTSEPTKEDEE